MDAGPQREREGAVGLIAAAQFGTELHDQTEQGSTCGGAVVDVVGEAVTDGRGGGLEAWGDSAGIDPAGPVDGHAANLPSKHPLDRHRRKRGEQANPVDAIALQGGRMAGADAVQILHRKQGWPAGDVARVDGQDAARVRDLRGGGGGDGLADTDAHVNAVPRDRPQPQHICEVGRGSGVIAQRAPQVDQHRSACTTGDNSPSCSRTCRYSSSGSRSGQRTCITTGTRRLSPSVFTAPASHIPRYRTSIRTRELRAPRTTNLDHDMPDDLPPDLDRLHTLRTWHAMWLERIDRQIAYVRKRQAEEERGRRNRPKPPDWVVELSRATSGPLQVHDGACGMKGKRHRAVSRDEARRRLTADAVPACPVCQPDTQLRIIGGLAARQNHPGPASNDRSTTPAVALNRRLVMTAQSRTPSGDHDSPAPRAPSPTSPR